MARCFSYGPTVIVRPSAAEVHCARNGHWMQAPPNAAADHARAGAGTDRHGVPGRAGHRHRIQVDPEPVLGKMPPHRRRRLNLHTFVNIVVVQPFQQSPDTVCRVTEHPRPGFGFGVGFGVGFGFGGQDVGR